MFFRFHGTFCTVHIHVNAGVRDENVTLGRQGQRESIGNMRLNGNKIRPRVYEKVRERRHCHHPIHTPQEMCR
jgi:hypothetical protein